MRRYIWDKQFILVRSARYNRKESYPVNSTTVKPPRLRDSEVAVWRGNDWEKLPERPAKPIPVKDRLQAHAFHIALRRANLYTGAIQYFNSSPELKIIWDHAPFFKRDDYFVQELKESLNIDDNQLNELFKEI